MAATTAAAGMVMTQAMTSRPNTFQLTEAPVLVAPTPLTAPATVWVVDTGAPKAADVEPARDEEIPAGLRPGAGSIIDARGVPASREVLDHGGTLDEAETAQRGAAHQPW